MFHCALDSFHITTMWSVKAGDDQLATLHSWPPSRLQLCPTLTCHHVEICLYPVRNELLCLVSAFEVLVANVTKAIDLWKCSLISTVT